MLKVLKAIHSNKATMLDASNFKVKVMKLEKKTNKEAATTGAVDGKTKRKAF